MKVAILVPRRESFTDRGRESRSDRDHLWYYCRPWWHNHFPEWPLYEGHHVSGLFNRSAGINRAAELAGDWDVALVIDSDVLAHPPDVARAVEMAHESGQMAVPFEIRHNLNEAMTRRIVDQGYAGSWKAGIHRTFGPPDHLQHSSVIAIPRRLWDRIGGFDEGFAGWGLEDTAFAIDCETFAGRQLERIWGGVVWHLYHGPAPEKHGSPPHRRNVARKELHAAAAARHDLEGIRALVEEGRALEASRRAYAIPPIIHRVVPEAQNATAERWWDRMAALHPAYRMWTHRDPLDPADYPLTAAAWPRVKAGAQLADLVRLEVLLTHGGIYVDQDVEPFRAFDPLLPLEAFAAWEDDTTVPNAILGARPEHPAIRKCLEAALALVMRGANVWDAGPGVTSRLLTDRPDVLLLPPGSLYPTHYADTDRAAKMAAVSREPPPWSFAQHWYAGSWLAPERQHPLPSDASGTGSAGRRRTSTSAMSRP